MVPHISQAFLNRVNKATIAHGTLMCLAFVVFFPLGSSVIRLGSFKGVIYVHAGIQIFAYFLALAGMGLGVYVAHAPATLGLGLPSQVSPLLSLERHTKTMKAKAQFTDWQISSYHRPDHHICPAFPAHLGIPSP